MCIKIPFDFNIFEVSNKVRPGSLELFCFRERNKSTSNVIVRLEFVINAGVNKCIIQAKLS